MNILISAHGNPKVQPPSLPRIVSQVLGASVRIVHLPDLYAALRVAHEWAVGNYRAAPGRVTTFEESHHETLDTPIPGRPAVGCRQHRTSATVHAAHSALRGSAAACNATDAEHPGRHA